MITSMHYDYIWLHLHMITSTYDCIYIWLHPDMITSTYTEYIHTVHLHMIISTYTVYIYTVHALHVQCAACCSVLQCVAFRLQCTCTSCTVYLQFIYFVHRKLVVLAIKLYNTTRCNCNHITWLYVWLHVACTVYLQFIYIVHRILVVLAIILYDYTCDYMLHLYCTCNPLYMWFVYRPHVIYL